MTSKDYYGTLGLKKDCSDDDIKKAYRSLAMTYHPDKSEGDKDVATEKFKQVAEAYQVLSDPEKRREYDMGGVDLSNHIRFANAFDIFSCFFGGGMHPGVSPGKFNFQVFNHTIMKPDPIVITVSCTIFEIFNGADRDISYTRTTPIGEEEVSVNVHIEKGWKDGTKLTYHGHGNKFHPSGQNGDLIIIIKEKPLGPDLVRSDNDLIFTHNISLKSALLGFEFTIVNLDGEKIPINLKNQVIPDGSEKKFLCKGIHSKTKIGDLIIRFKVIYPPSLSPEQIELIEKYF